MNKEILKLIKESVNREKKENIDELYRTIWINTLIQFKENNHESGVHFWLRKKESNNYSLLYYGENGLTEKILNMNEDEKGAIEIMLLDDGFEITETKNNNTLLMISKDAILEYAKTSTNQKKKMPITPFAETRRR